jgi:hypothetical protein
MPILNTMVGWLTKIPAPVIKIVAAFGLLTAALKIGMAIKTVYTNFAIMTGIIKATTTAEVENKVATGEMATMDAIAASKTKILSVAQVQEKLTTLGTTSALKAGIVTMGLYALAVAGIMADIYLLVKAYQAWQSAEAAIQQEMQQAKGEVSTGQAAMQKVQAWQAAHPGQALPASYQQLQDYAQQAINEGQGNIGRNWLKNLPWNLLTGKGLKMAAGGEFVAKRQQTITVGERGDEHVKVTPLGKGGLEPKVVVDNRGAIFVGTSRDAAGRIMEMLNGAMGPRVDGLTRGRFADA